MERVEWRSVYAAALEEAIHCAGARRVAMIVQRRLDLALEGPLNGLGLCPWSAVGASRITDMRMPMASPARTRREKGAAHPLRHWVCPAAVTIQQT